MKSPLLLRRLILSISLSLIIKGTVFSQIYIENYGSFDKVSVNGEDSQKKNWVEKDSLSLEKTNMEYAKHSFELYKQKLKLDLIQLKLKDSLLSEAYKKNDQHQIIKYSDERKHLQEDFMADRKAYQLSKIFKDSCMGEYYLMHQENSLSPLTHAFKSYRNGYAKAFNREYYGTNEFSILQGLSLSGNNNIANLSTELLSDYLGLFRFGLYGTLSATDTGMQTNTDETVQRFINGGGQIAIAATLPVYLFSAENHRINFSLSLNDKIGTDAIGVDNTNNDFSFNNQVFAEGRLSFGTDQGKFSFFINSSAAYVVGNNKFYSSIGSRETNLGQASFGIILQETYLIKIAGPIFSNNETLLRQPFQLGIQINR